MTWRLLFSGFQSFGWTIGVSFAVVIAFALFVLLRKYEARLVSPFVGRTLLVLRILILSLLLLVLLQPVLTQVWSVDLETRLVVAVDVSQSMDTADRHASSSEKLKWAQGLGMLGNETTDALLREWSEAYDAGVEPDWNGPEGDADLGKMRRRQLSGIFDEIAEMPRTEFVRRLLLASPNELLKQLEAVQPVDLRAFGAKEQQVSPKQIEALLKADRLEFQPTGTDAAGILSRALSDAGDAEVRGVVLLTDGRQTENADAVAEASRLGTLGIPVYCVPIGSQLMPRDLSIASLEVPETVFLDDNAQLRATVTSTGYAGEVIDVILEKDGREIDRSAQNVSSDYFEVEFELPAEEAGSHDYTIRTDVRPGELRDDNNGRDFSVTVVDNKSRVMIVEGDARWEFRYLKSALERDPQVELSVVLLNQPFLKLLNRPFIDNQMPDAASIRDQLGETDILIVGDVAPKSISDEVWKIVDQAVANDGLTLLFIPGKRFLPKAYESATFFSLLPVSDFEQHVAERLQRTLPNSPSTSFRLQPTPESSDLTLFRLTSPGEETQVTVGELPGHPWAFTGTPKPAASVWAELMIPGRKLRNRLPAVIHQYYGFGQTLWMGVDSTWRWRRRAGDRWHHRFWGQIVRWATRNKAASGNDQVRLSLSDIVFDETETVDATARWDPGLVGQLAGADVHLLVERQSSPLDSQDETQTGTQEIRLIATDAAPERYVAELPRLRPGTYKVSLALNNAPFALEQEVSTEVVVSRRSSSELANVSCHRVLLRQIAEASGGKVLEPWELDTLPELVQPRNQSASEVQEVSLWDTWPVMLAFFALLMMEWVIRKLNGLP